MANFAASRKAGPLPFLPLGVAAFRSWLGERRCIEHGKLGLGWCPMPEMLAADAVPGESRETLEEVIAFDLQGIERSNELFGGGFAADGIAEATGKTGVCGGVRLAGEEGEAHDARTESVSTMRWRSGRVARSASL